MGEGILGLESLGLQCRSGFPHVPSPSPAVPSQGSIDEDKPKAQDATHIPGICLPCEFPKMPVVSAGMLLWCFCPLVLEPQSPGSTSWGRASSSTLATPPPLPRLLSLLFTPGWGLVTLSLIWGTSVVTPHLGRSRTQGILVTTLFISQYPEKRQSMAWSTQTPGTY